MMTERLCILGSTGSIGTQTLDVVREFPRRFSVAALSAGNNLEKLADQILEFNPMQVVIKNREDVAKFKHLLPDYAGELLVGPEGLNQIASSSNTQTLVVGLTGMIGLEPTLSALKYGKKVLTANKETFVAGGHLVAPYLHQIIPIDSEHSAIFQCLKGEKNQKNTIQKLYLTASGGPFRTSTPAQMDKVNPTAALNHPNWVMGRKVTIDSATLMNKGLEVIEAHWLFGVAYNQVEVVIHPQSIMHSGVAFIDGSVLFQLGQPTMLVPIQYALFFPERQPTPFKACHLDILSVSKLELEAPDLKRFPCLELAYEAGKKGGSAPAVLNAADEVAVDLFLDEKIKFMDIPRLIEAALADHLKGSFVSAPSLSDIQGIDQITRDFVRRQCQNKTFAGVK